MDTSSPDEWEEVKSAKIVLNYMLTLQNKNYLINIGLVHCAK